MGFLFPVVATIIGLFIVVKLEQLIENRRNIKKRLIHVESLLETLQIFICESDVLKNEVVTFSKKRFVPHGFLSSNKECRCLEIENRTTFLEDKALFWDKYGGRINEDFEKRNDVDHTECFDPSEKTREEIIKTELMPLLMKMHETDPDKITKYHLEWLKNPDFKPGPMPFYFYLSWLIHKFQKFPGDKIPSELKAELIKKYESIFPETNVA